MTRCTFSTVDINWVLDIGSFAHHQNILLKTVVLGPSAVAAVTSLDICKPIPVMKLGVGSGVSGHRANPLGTCGFSFPGHVVLRDVEKMLDTLLYGNGTKVTSHTGDTVVQASSNEMKIYRIKGVLHVADDPSVLYLFQGVHDIFELSTSDIAVGSTNDTTDGLNKVIVIGKNLDMLMIEEKFIDCIAG